ncbi:Interphotoreceptor matrix proteoglycan 2 [Merluccius polli]|uniref:Interphotoreceptor matrix proteoglycan 2 n=1 Tax=Merluccius polli TaxID=89951 RepID=A0AA47M2S7_MERPO|nr:Interphotoreceptor matrix proteoglycan 2 [Merluccius polli]
MVPLQLVPYLQSNLSSFQNLEILNFQNGSVVVNSRMRFGRPVPQRVASVVYLILEDWAESAHRTMDLAIDKHSLDVESGDKADPCKFQACNEFSRCAVNDWSGEAECVCSAGYVSMGGLPCRSVCLVHPDFCLNDGKCDIIPGTGAICRCRVGENWWYRGQHCEEYVSEPLVVAIAMVSVVGFLLVGSGVLFFLVRTLRDQYQSDDSEDPLRHGVSASSLEGSSEFSLYQSDTVSAQFYRRYDDHLPQYCGGGDTRHGSSLVPQDPPDQDSDQSHHNISNTRLTTQERLRMLELYAKDEHFADFVSGEQTELQHLVPTCLGSLAGNSESEIRCAFCFGKPTSDQGQGLQFPPQCCRCLGRRVLEKALYKEDGAVNVQTH